MKKKIIIIMMLILLASSTVFCQLPDENDPVKTSKQVHSFDEIQTMFDYLQTERNVDDPDNVRIDIISKKGTLVEVLFSDQYLRINYINPDNENMFFPFELVSYIDVVTYESGKYVIFGKLKINQKDFEYDVIITEELIIISGENEFLTVRNN